MERDKTNTVVDDGKIRYKKIGGGSLRFGGKIIKPQQIFKARPDEIPEAFKDVIIPLDEVKEKQLTEEAIPAGKVAEYILQPRANSKLWFDVVDSQGKVLNEKALKKEVAERLIADMEK